MSETIDPKKRKLPKCEDCGTTVGVEHIPCPFAHEIHNDSELHWLCDDCAWRRAQET